MNKFSDSFKNLGNISRVSMLVITIGGIIFQVGKLSEKVDTILPKVHSLEENQKANNNVLFDIHGKVSSLNEKIDGIGNDVKMIKKRVFR